jgi:hypothetical protein
VLRKEDIVSFSWPPVKVIVHDANAFREGT